MGKIIMINGHLQNFVCSILCNGHLRTFECSTRLYIGFRVDGALCMRRQNNTSCVLLCSVCKCMYGAV